MITLPNKTFWSACAQAHQPLPAQHARQLRAHWYRCAALLIATVLQVTAAIQTAVGESRASQGAPPTLGGRCVAHPADRAHRSTLNAMCTAAHFCDGAVL